jgi:hypothetical protein
MANYTYNCGTNKANTGFKGFCQKIGLIKGYILTDDDVEFTTEALAQLKANWTSKIQARTMYPFKAIMGVENQGDEATYEDTPFATELVTNGKMAWRFAHTFSMPSHKAYFTHRSNSGRIILINGTGEFVGEETGTGGFRGFKTSLVNIENLMLTDGSASEKTYIKVVLENAEDINRSMVTVVPTDFSGLDLMGLIDVRLTTITAVPTNVHLEASLFSTGDTQDGFVTGDFTWLNSSGAAVTITTFTPKVDGVYQFQGAALIAGTYTVKFVPESMTTKGFATPVILTVTVA